MRGERLVVVLSGIESTYATSGISQAMPPLWEMEPIPSRLRLYAGTRRLVGRVQEEPETPFLIPQMSDSDFAAMAEKESLEREPLTPCPVQVSLTSAEDVSSEESAPGIRRCRYGHSHNRYRKPCCPSPAVPECGILSMVHWSEQRWHQGVNRCSETDHRPRMYCNYQAFAIHVGVSENRGP